MLFDFRDGDWNSKVALNVKFKKFGLFKCHLKKHIFKFCPITTLIFLSVINYIIKFSLNPGIKVAGYHGTLVCQARCDLGVLGGNPGDATNMSLLLNRTSDRLKVNQGHL